MQQTSKRKAILSSNQSAVLGVLAICAFIFWYGQGPSDDLNGKTQVTFWAGWAGEELDVVKGFVNQFNLRQKDVVVKTTSIADSYQKMKVAFAGNDTPDVCSTVWSQELVDYAMRGGLEPLDGYFATSQRSQDDYNPAVWEAMQYDGHIYGIPQSMITFYIGYNKKIFRQAGITEDQLPQTIEEFDQLAQRLTRYLNDDPSQEILCLGYPYGDTMGDITNWMIAFGVDLWDPQTRRTLVNSPQALACLEWYKKNVDLYGFDRLRAYQSSFGNITSPNNPFISGRVAMINMGSWYRGVIEQYAPPDFEWGWFAIPSPPGGRPNSTFLMGSMYVIPKASRHKKEAWEFIEWMTSAYVSEHQHVGNSPGAIPAVRAGQDSPTFSDDYWRFIRGLMESPNATAPMVPLYERLASELNRVTDFVLCGKKTPGQALSELQNNFQTEVDAVYRTLKSSEQLAGRSR